MPLSTPLGLLFLGQKNARANASPDVDLVLGQEELPAAVVDLRVL